MSQSDVPLRAVVTGASSGIGRGIAIRLAEFTDARIVVHYCSNRVGAEETLASIRERGGDGSIVQADICQADERTSLIEKSWEALGQPNTWVNNAGADVLTGARGNLSFREKLSLLFDTDVISTIELSRAVASRLVGSRYVVPPSMAFIGWDQAPEGMEGDAGQMFGPVKAAIMAFAASLAQELAPRVRVNTVAPGWIQTAWGDNASESWQRRAAAQSLMNRWGKPEDVAAAVAYIVDPKNSFCTGQTINANGGWNRRGDGG